MNSQISYLLGQLATLGPIGTKLPAPGTAGSVVAIIAGYFLLPMGWIPFLMHFRRFVWDNSSFRVECHIESFFSRASLSAAKSASA